jgi:hypothetical protein
MPVPAAHKVSAITSAISRRDRVGESPLALVVFQFRSYLSFLSSCRCFLRSERAETSTGYGPRRGKKTRRGNGVIRCGRALEMALRFVVSASRRKTSHLRAILRDPSRTQQAASSTRKKRTAFGRSVMKTTRRDVKRRRGREREREREVRYRAKCAISPTAADRALSSIKRN